MTIFGWQVVLGGAGVAFVFIIASVLASSKKIFFYYFGKAIALAAIFAWLALISLGWGGD